MNFGTPWIGKKNLNVTGNFWENPKYFHEYFFKLFVSRQISFTLIRYMGYMFA